VRLGNERGKFLNRERLAHDSIGAERESVPRHLRCAVGGHQDDLRTGRIVPDAAQQSEIVRIGQPEIEQDDVGLRRVCQRQSSLGRIRGLGDDVAAVGERFRQRPPDQRLVVHDQDS